MKGRLRELKMKIFFPTIRFACPIMFQGYATHSTFDVTSILDKGGQSIKARFFVRGEITILCDRNLDEFDCPLEAESKPIFKYGNKYEECSDGVIVKDQKRPIPETDQRICECIEWATPMKKLHPRFYGVIVKRNSSYTLYS